MTVSTAGRSTKLRWGVLGVARIATKKVIPAMQRGRWTEVDAIASRDAARARDAAAELGIAQGLWLVRGVARRSRNRRRLHSAAQPHARRVDDARGGGGQTRAVREADRVDRGGRGTIDRGTRSHGRADPGSVHGADAPAVAGRAGHRAVGAHRRNALHHGLLQLLQRRPGEHQEHQGIRRRRDPRHRVLSREHRADDLRGGAAPRVCAHRRESRDRGRLDGVDDPRLRRPSRRGHVQARSSRTASAS